MAAQPSPGPDRHALGLAGTIVASCLFGLGVVCTKAGVGQASVPTLLGWRFLVSFTLMTLLILAGAWLAAVRSWSPDPRRNGFSLG